MRAPHRARAIFIAPVDVSRVDEPLLGDLLRSALSRELARRGVQLPAVRTAGSAVLGARILRLDGGNPALAGSAPAAIELTVALELWLRDARDVTLWRSGLLELHEAWPLQGETLRSERSRRVVLGQAADRAAVMALERLELSDDRRGELRPAR